MTDEAGRKRGDQAKGIADILRTEIVTGALAPGVRLGQDALAERFGLSRMPVREALLLLEAEGLVELPPNRSAIVASLGAADMLDIFDMRIALETLALRLAIPLLGNAAIAEAQTIQDRLERADPRDFGSLNAQFHTALYTACGRPRLLSQIHQLSGLADRYLRLAITSSPQRALSDAEHRALIAFCFDRDADRAAAVLEKHIATARNGLLRLLESQRTSDSGRVRSATASRLSR